MGFARLSLLGHDFLPISRWKENRVPVVNASYPLALFLANRRLTLVDGVVESMIEPMRTAIASKRC